MSSGKSGPVTYWPEEPPGRTNNPTAVPGDTEKLNAVVALRAVHGAVVQSEPVNNTSYTPTLGTKLRANSKVAVPPVVSCVAEAAVTDSVAALPPVEPASLIAATIVNPRVFPTPMSFSTNVPCTSIKLTVTVLRSTSPSAFAFAGYAYATSLACDALKP